MTPRTLRATLEADGPALGAWLQMPNPIAAEAVGRLDFDWVGIDTQHGMIGYQEMRSMLQAIAISGTPAIVRVAANDPAEIGRALDTGAQGVIVPLIESAEQAARVVDAMRYPPRGHRSWGAIRPAMEHAPYGPAPPYSPAVGDERAVCIAMVETVAAVERVDEIVAVDGLDAIHVGPSDLAASAGMPPMLELRDPEHRRLAERIATSCREAGRWVGIHPPSPEIATYVQMGFKVMPVYRDLPALADGAKAALATARTTAT